MSACLIYNANDTSATDAARQRVRRAGATVDWSQIISRPLGWGTDRSYAGVYVRVIDGTGCFEMNASAAVEEGVLTASQLEAGSLDPAEMERRRLQAEANIAAAPADPWRFQNPLLASVGESVEELPDTIGAATEWAGDKASRLVKWAADTAGKAGGGLLGGVLGGLGPVLVVVGLVAGVALIVTSRK